MAWISNFIPHLTMDVITGTYPDHTNSMLVKGTLESKEAAVGRALYIMQ